MQTCSIISNILVMLDHTMTIILNFLSCYLCVVSLTSFLPSLFVSKVIHVVCLMVSFYYLQRLYNAHMYGIKREDSTCIC